MELFVAAAVHYGWGVGPCDAMLHVPSPLCFVVAHLGRRREKFLNLGTCVLDATQTRAEVLKFSLHAGKCEAQGTQSGLFFGFRGNFPRLWFDLVCPLRSPSCILKCGRRECMNHGLCIDAVTPVVGTAGAHGE